MLVATTFQQCQQKFCHWISSICCCWMSCKFYVCNKILRL